MEELVMKKLMVLFVFISLAFVWEAAGKMNYVTVGDKTYFSSDIKIGLTNVRITTENGLTLKAPLKMVNAYSIDGKQCERVPLVYRNGEVQCSALLELVSIRNGLKLFKLNAYSGDSPHQRCCFSNGSSNHAKYFVYKDGKLHLRVDGVNAPTVFGFFHVKYNKAE